MGKAKTTPSDRNASIRVCHVESSCPSDTDLLADVTLNPLPVRRDPGAAPTASQTHVALNKMMLAEIAALICPRALCIEAGQHDELFDVDLAATEVDKVQTRYEHLGLASRFQYAAHPGVHELDTADDGIDFFVRHLID